MLWYTIKNYDINIDKIRIAPVADFSELFIY